MGLENNALAAMVQNSIRNASEESSQMARRIARLYILLIIVGTVQVIATAWGYLSWWWHNWHHWWQP